MAFNATKILLKATALVRRVGNTATITPPIDPITYDPEVGANTGRPSTPFDVKISPPFPLEEGWPTNDTIGVGDMVCLMCPTELTDQSLSITTPLLNASITTSDGQSDRDGIIEGLVAITAQDVLIAWVVKIAY